MSLLYEGWAVTLRRIQASSSIARPDDVGWLGRVWVVIRTTFLFKYMTDADHWVMILKSYGWLSWVLLQSGRMSHNRILSGAKWQWSDQTSKLTASYSDLTLRGSDLTFPSSVLTLPGSGLTLPGPDLTLPGSDLTLPGSELTLSGSDLTTPGSHLNVSGSDVTLAGSDLTDQTCY